jgi:uncharacterized repeat protein (TIGR01451 family)
VVTDQVLSRSFEVGITKTVDRATARRGDPLLYTVTVTNRGADPLTGVFVTDPIPTGTTYVNGSAQPAATFANNALRWDIGNLEVGGVRTMTFRVTINADAPRELVNTAEVRTNETPPREARATTVVQRPDFDLVKTVDKGEAKPGDILNYTVKVTNTGDMALTNLLITDDIPAGTTYVANSASNGGQLAGRTLTWRFPTLAVGQTVTVTFQVTINADAPSRIENVVIARTDEVGPKEARVPTVITRVAGVVLTRTGVSLTLVFQVLFGLGLLLVGAGLLLRNGGTYPSRPASA